MTAEAGEGIGQCEIDVARIPQRVAKLGFELYLFFSHNNSVPLFAVAKILNVE